ncbi:nitroreductase family protein [Acidobacteriota bacterium]
MKIYDTIKSRRTIRQFRADTVPRKLLERMVNAARLAPSAANRQPLEFLVVDDKEIVTLIFPHIKWAAYIAPNGNPRPGNEPTAYILTMVNTDIRQSGFEWDAGAAIENMILTAQEEGVGSCWILSFDKEAAGRIVGLPDKYKIDSILALGYPNEDPAVEDLTDSVKYWKDKSGRLHVPKRTLESVIHYNGFQPD